MTLTAFVNAHVVPIAAEPFDGTLLVEDGRITALGPEVEAPGDAEVVDCEGRSARTPRTSTRRRAAPRPRGWAPPS